MVADSSSSPMIEVESLTKHYAGVVAVHDISFSVNRGETVGFLGPNGAGKSTTLRILAGFLPASGGEVRVAGLDVFTDSRAVRRRIGYLPENCPLHLDMRVDEYLAYRGRLKGVSRADLRGAMADAVARCGLSDVRRRIIGQLSKGFRQRVGLADAILHRPDLLILDEPTVGLDPNQVLQVRELVRDLGRSTTILLSTHQLSEVEATCGRVILVSGGRIVASDTLAGLRSAAGGGVRAVVEAQITPEAARLWVESIEGLRAGRLECADGWCRIEVMAGADRDPRAELFDAALRRGHRLREIRLVSRSLEDAFVELTRPAGQGAS